MDEGEGVAGEVFKILGETATAIEPGEGPLDDPASRQNFEPLGLVRAFDDFWFELWKDSRNSVCKLWPLIAAVSKELLQKGEHTEQGRQQQHAAVAVLNIRRMHDGVKQ